MMPCRNCPNFLERAIVAIQDVQRDRPELLPPEFDYNEIQHALQRLANNVREELIRQGRLR